MTIRKSRLSFGTKIELNAVQFYVSLFGYGFGIIWYKGFEFYFIKPSVYWVDEQGKPIGKSMNSCEIALFNTTNRV